MNLCTLVRNRAASGAPAVILPGEREPEVVPWRDVAARSERVAAGLLAAGLAPLEAVAVLAGQPELAIPAFFGVWLAGGILALLAPGEAEAQLVHAECRLVLDDGEVARLLEPGDRLPTCAAARPEGGPSGPGSDDIACYAYLRSDPPLAAKLSHSGLLSAARGLAVELALGEGDRLASSWPRHEVMHLALVLAAAAAGAAIAGGSAGAFSRTRPTVLGAPYFAIEELARRIAVTAAGPGRLRGRAWRWALDTAVAEHRKQAAGRTWRGRLAARAGLDRALAPYGGSVRLALASGETPSRRACEVLGALGVRVATVYSVPEAGGPVTVGEPVSQGDAGEPIEGTDVQVADDGHVLVGGKGLFAGYLKEPELTRRSQLGGWFRTGERGEFAGGRLRLLGPLEAERGLLVRVTAPEVEGGLRGQDEIGLALAVPGTPWTALVVPAGPLIDDISARSGISPAEALTDPRLEAALQRAVAAYNARADYEGRVTHYTILADLPHDGMGRLVRTADRLAEALEKAVPAPLPGILELP